MSNYKEAVARVHVDAQPDTFVNCVRCKRQAVVGLRSIGSSGREFGFEDNAPQWCQLIIGSKVYDGCPQCFPANSPTPKVLTDFATACVKESAVW